MLAFCLSPTEIVELGKRIEELERPEAAKRRAATLKQGDEESRSGNLPEREKGQTRDKVAAVLGTSPRTYEKAKQVVEAAEKEPENLTEKQKEIAASPDPTKAAKVKLGPGELLTVNS